MSHNMPKAAIQQMALLTGVGLMVTGAILWSSSPKGPDTVDKVMGFCLMAVIAGAVGLNLFEAFMG